MRAGCSFVPTVVQLHLQVLQLHRRKAPALSTNTKKNNIQPQTAGVKYKASARFGVLKKKYEKKSKLLPIELESQQC